MLGIDFVVEADIFVWLCQASLGCGCNLCGLVCKLGVGDRVVNCCFCCCRGIGGFYLERDLRCVGDGLGIGVWCFTMLLWKFLNAFWGILFSYDGGVELDLLIG